ncbi:MAG: NAD(+) diphosphatase [Actinomycetota bacterium]|nr:NAD(+) diphosphatase [Actinomycetota bacterium]
MSPVDPTSAGRPFTGLALDRAGAQRKDPAWVRARLDEASARAVSAGAHGVLVSEQPKPKLLRSDRVAANGQEPILLGLEGGAALFAHDLDRVEASTDPEHATGGRVVSLRDAGSMLAHEEAGLAAYLVALLNWHRRHGFCANCGAATVVAEAGYSRHCPRCQRNHFPRTDPVVIMTVEHDGRLLLGRRHGWPAGRLSVLAGFVSPGESAEEAVIREVQEESGIRAHDPVFVTSQPWPFPASLMLGFHARAEDGQPRPRDGELEEVRWLTGDEVRQALIGDNPSFQPPGPVSIARYLIERWAAGQTGLGV